MLFFMQRLHMGSTNSQWPRENKMSDVQHIQPCYFLCRDYIWDQPIHNGQEKIRCLTYNIYNHVIFYAEITYGINQLTMAQR